MRAGGSHGAEGRVGVGGGDSTFCGVELADVLGEIPAVCVPRAVDSDSQRASGYGLGGVPRHEPHDRMMAAGEVDTGDLQIAAVDVALVERDAAVDGYLFEGSSPHGIVLTFDNRVAFTVGEGNRAIFGVIDG